MMNDYEVEQVMSALTRLWPRKFNRPEFTADFAQRMQRYPLADVIAALDAHKDGSKFGPEPAEIHVRLKGKGGAGGDESRGSTASHADIIRQSMRMHPTTTDAEALMRFRRWEIGRYRERFAGLTMTGEQARTRDEMIARHTAGRKVVCANAVAASGIEPARAERLADLIDAERGVFVLALTELRGASFAEECPV